MNNQVVLSQRSQVLPVDSCTLCGWRGQFSDDTAISREAHRCGGCGAGLRYRNQAASILTHLGRGRHVTLQNMAGDPELTGNAAIYEVALHGPFIRHLSKFKDYVRSYFWHDIPLGEVKDGIRCEDLRQLTFPEERFDCIVSSDVMEHVFDYEAALAEIFRVLRPNGVHVMAIPVTWPIPETSVKRAEEIDGSVVHHMEQRFHRAGDGSATLVCTDFGWDLLGLLDDIGYESWFERPSMMRHPGYFDAVVVCRKPRRSGRASGPGPVRVEAAG